MKPNEKRYIKSLQKHTFEEQISEEFKSFSKGMLQRMSEQNRLLKELISMQKLKHTSLQKLSSTNIKQELLEINDDKQSEVVQHLIDIPELFHDPYPFEKFEMNEFSGLQKESLKFYKNQLKFWKNDKPLVYYFFEHRNLSEGVKLGIKLTYMQFMQKY